MLTFHNFIQLYCQTDFRWQEMIKWETNHMVCSHIWICFHRFLQISSALSHIKMSFFGTFKLHKWIHSTTNFFFLQLKIAILNTNIVPRKIIHFTSHVFRPHNLSIVTSFIYSLLNSHRGINCLNDNLNANCVHHVFYRSKQCPVILSHEILLRS